MAQSSLHSDLESRRKQQISVETPKPMEWTEQKNYQSASPALLPPLLEQPKANLDYSMRRARNKRSHRGGGTLPGASIQLGHYVRLLLGPPMAIDCFAKDLC